MATPKTANEPKNAKNTAPAGDKGAPAFELPDFESWEKEQVGFAPYWNPEPGKWFYGTVVSRDERDPEFVRYLVKTYAPITVQRGPKEDAELIELKPGDLFSISVYYSLAEPFDFILEHFVLLGKEVPMMVKALKEVKTKKAGQTCWTWEMRLPPEWKKALADKRTELRLAAAHDAEERAALAESNA